MNITHLQRCLVVVVLLSTGVPTLAEDWPMWRRDPGRKAQSAEKIPDDLKMIWHRELPPLVPAFRNSRLQFDAGYEPVVAGKTLFVGSSANDSLTAYHTETGEQRWRFYTEGPIRFAPVVWQDRVFFGSDDGCLYCLTADEGKLLWKFRAVPSARKILGSGRLISVWPIRGGPVIADDVLYFAAGVWSFEGVFVYAMDPANGKVLWRNDRSGSIYGLHPHPGAEALGGLTPQGYLVVSGEDLIVPCGSALPGKFDRKTGKLKSFNFPSKGRYPGGWFTAEGRAIRLGKKDRPPSEVVSDIGVNTDRHENGKNFGPGGKSIRDTIEVGGNELSFEDTIPGVEGKIHSILAADDKLFVVTLSGSIYCLGSKGPEPKKFTANVKDRSPSPQPVVQRAEQILRATNVRHGYCLMLGVGQGNLIGELLDRTELQVIAVDPDVERIASLRKRYDGAGEYGTRVSLHVGEPLKFEFPPYLANLIVCENLVAAGWDPSLKLATTVLRCLRPYGGKAFVGLRPDQGGVLSLQYSQADEQGEVKQAKLESHKSHAVLTRVGALPGSSNYLGGWKSSDKLVKAPLGVLWYDDEVGNFKRAPQPQFVDGVMITYDKSWLGYVTGDRPPYALKKPIYSDVYTGRVFSQAELASRIESLPSRDIKLKQPSQYRPPTQKNDWSPKKPVIGERVNPLTGQKEPRAIVKSYGCDGGNDYGLLFTMRSGTAAFYDKRIESGTIHISGPRSGCTNSIIPANGILNVPYFFQGCTCSYPLPVGLALVNMPPEYEQWMVWGPGKPENIQRVGINLGAPGDRVTEAGTLWLEYPTVGGPTPEVAVRIEPASVVSHYRHSLWIDGGSGWPWVSASGVEGLTSITIDGLKKTSYTVRLYFAEPDRQRKTPRVFDVALQGNSVIEQFEVAQEAGGPMRSLVKEFSNVSSEGTIQVTFTPRKGSTILNGIELVAEGLTLGEVPILSDR